MVRGFVRRWPTAVATLASLAFVPGGAVAQPVGPTTLAEAPRITLALASVAVVVLVGGGFLGWSSAFVDRAVDDTMAKPAVAIVYGLLAFVLVVFAGFYANDLLSRVGLAGTPLGYVALAILVVGVLAVGSLGYLVVGTVLTDLYGDRRPWPGLLVGASISAACWLALPLAAAAPAWVVVAAVGVGGTTRTWVHSERTVDTEVES